MPDASHRLALTDACAVVTGGGHGIGRALADALAARGARVVVADLDVDRATAVAARIGGLAVRCDVADLAQIEALVATARREVGPVDLFCSNAGIGGVGDDLDCGVDDFRRIVDVNLMAHIWAARAVVPEMLERGGGALLQTVSAAGLVTGPMGAGYATTKHGALGFAEWLALRYAHRGLQVTCLCPSAVRSGMTGHDERLPDGGPSSPTDMPGMLEPEHCAAVALDALCEGRFLALPHPDVGERFLAKATDYDRWLASTAASLRRGNP